ncbi:LLM class flavin-dependent oxidoreductase [Jongsikchunia kroppenstedtii]|uniref:LLM class flavin-dependent oxidoreductase n=1 Tax=Jongsikchunia kroppenstedtii TaxID=1121721 RepID=UPI00047769D6|nr:LLM class flavin-dependent oxidoreductase [Jongsikchunia kroppenstedtii]
MTVTSTDPDSPPISILDLARIGPGESVAQALAASVELAQLAERLGYRRIWYAEHHNFPSIGSSATAVVIGHIAAHTSSIRLGSGGIMLPNHSPLTIAEQFGTLTSLYPGRIDLGLGRAPGTDQQTLFALRRDMHSANRFPEDVQELQAFLGEQSIVPGVRAVPGEGTEVPLYILGSSLFGAQLAAVLGLPYAFASHFAPDALHAAVGRYRADFRPSAQLSEPYVLAAVNVVAADDAAAAEEQVLRARVERTKALLGRGVEMTDEQARELYESPAGRQVSQMTKYSAVGTGPQVRAYLDEFRAHADADELIVVPAAPDRTVWLRSIELVAHEYGLRPTPA